ncbi:MAG: hypothetical protein SFU98_07060 [Leptospiraceae bacterium]|nr:hypothetical protein [Leptospiraceae bacterium]
MGRVGEFIITMLRLNPILETITEKLSDKFHSHNFLVESVNNTSSDKSIIFISEGIDISYKFLLDFKRDTTIIFLYISLYSKEIISLMRNAKIYQEKRSVFSVDIGFLINPLNKDGYFNSNDNKEIKIYPNLDDVIENIYTNYFIEGTKKFIDKTNSIFKLDTLINEKVIIDRKIKPLVYFGSSSLLQIMVGLMVSFLCKNPWFEILQHVYTDYVNQFDSSKYNLVVKFHRLLEHLKEQ